MKEKEFTPSRLHWRKSPETNSPLLVVGFQGWSNAGSASSDTLQYLMDVLRPEIIATIDEEFFLNLATDRPVTDIEDGIIHEFDPLEADVTFWKNSEGGRDLILMLGREPHFNWSDYARIIFEIMEKFGVEKLFTVGGVQDSVSHNAPPVISIVGTSAQVMDSVIAMDDSLRKADYRGPASIHTFLLQACSRMGYQGVGLWGHCPAYLQKCPRLVAKVVSILNKSAGMSCPVQLLKAKAAELDGKINEALARDPDLKQFVDTIESDTRKNAPGNQKVIHLNDFLKKDPRKEPDS